MITCEQLFQIFKKNDLTYFTGVPDSTFKDWMKFLAEDRRVTNRIAANECEATALAAGYHAKSGKIGVVYMQNSGLGKVVNPVTSLIDPAVYAIPTLFLIGWRGEPGTRDEPQHIKMGRVMMPLLDALEIPFDTLPIDEDGAQETIAKMKQAALDRSGPAAIILRKGSLEKYEAKNLVKTSYELSREDAIKAIADKMLESAAVVSTTGKCSRELFEYRVAKGQPTSDFYTVGSMGCSASIAAEIALQDSDRPVYVFDGDGAVIMQMGALATIGHFKPKNLIHIIFDNGSYDSTGGQPTVSDTVNFKQVALGCGYALANTVKTRADLESSLNSIGQGPSMLIIKVNKGARKDLGRPTSTPVENKAAFMQKLNS